MDRQFHVRVFFDLYWVFSQVLNIINLNMLCPIQVRNFWQFLVFKKHQSWVWIVQSARIFISEHSDTYSHKIWNVIYRLVQIYKRIAKKFYPKLTIYLSTVFCRGHYLCPSIYNNYLYIDIRPKAFLNVLGFSGLFSLL